MIRLVVKQDDLLPVIDIAVDDSVHKHRIRFAQADKNLICRNQQGKRNFSFDKFMFFKNRLAQIGFKKAADIADSDSFCDLLIQNSVLDQFGNFFFD